MTLELDDIERRTFRRHAFSQVFESTFTSFCWAGADVAVKGFDASTLVVTLITMAPGAMQLLSLFASKPMVRLGRRRLLRWSALAGRLPLLLVLGIGGPYQFLFLLTLQAVAQVFVTASWNSLLRCNYRDAHRGTLFARANVFGALASGMSMIGAGLWLEYDPTAYRIIYPVAAAAGLLACWIFADIDVRKALRPEDEELTTPHGFGDLLNILKQDRHYRRYEIGFMLYGLAFMAVMTAKPIRMGSEDQLNFEYDVLLGARGIFSFFMVIATLSMGRFLDRRGPADLASRCFVLLVIYALILFSIQSPWQLFLAEAVFGTAMAGVHVAWNLGPITFAPNASSATSYMLIHVAAVGVRAIFGHSLGGILVETTGEPRIVFAVAVVLFGLGTLVMRQLARDRRIELQAARPDT